MNNTNTKNLALAAILAAVLIVVGTFVALQPANAIDEVYSHFTATICIDDTPCVTKICINDEPCHNPLYKWSSSYFLLTLWRRICQYK